MLKIYQKNFGKNLKVDLWMLIWLMAKWIAFLTTLMASLTPSLFTFSINTSTPSTLFFFIYLLLIYIFFTKKLSSESLPYIIIFSIAVFTSSKSLIIVLGSATYFLLLRLEFIPLKKREFEVLFFSGMFGIWYYSLFFKSFFTKGLSSIWDGIPKEILNQYFVGLNLPMAISFIGFLPMILGFYALYRVLFNERNRKLMFLISLTFAWGLATWAGLIQFKEGLVFATINLVLLSGYTFNRFATYFKKTKIVFVRSILAGTIIILLIANFIPALSYGSVLKNTSPTKQELETMNYLGTINSTDVVLGAVEDGHLISALANKKNVFDEEYFFAPETQERWDDVKKIFLTKSDNIMMDLVEAYNISYIYISRNVIKRYGYQTLFEDNECFEKIYETKDTEVFHLICEREN